MVKKLEIIGVQMDMGASKRGVGMGPMAIRLGGVVRGLESEGHKVVDRGDVYPMRDGESRDSLRNYEQVIDVNKKLYTEVKDILDKGHTPIVLGGDHSVAAGSISAVAKSYEDRGGIGVIWIDAHGDWNDETTSETGNMHGMPYSAICGWGPDCMVDYGQVPAYVDVTKCVQIGGRDMDKAERMRMKEAGVTVFPINKIDQLGMYDVITQAIEIAGNGTAGIHLSFDIDAVTPEEAPGTGTKVHSGITAREAFLAVEELAASGKMLSMDMVEVNPILDEQNKTGELASELIQSAFGKDVY